MAEDVSSILKQLEQLTEEIEKVKKEISSKEGQLVQIWAGLKKYNITTEKQLTERIDTLAKKRKQLEITIPKKFEELKQKYEW